MKSDIISIAKGFSSRLKNDNISAFSAQAAFFMIMSIAPFASLLLTLVKYLPISQSMVLEVIDSVLPDAFTPIVTGIFMEMYEKSNSTILSISVLIAMWSASRGVLSIVNGLESVYHVKKKRNYINLRIISAMYTIIFVSAIIFTLLLMVFGNNIYNILKKEAPGAAGIIEIFLKQKYIISMCLLSLFFLMVYKMVRRRENHVLESIPGAVISSLSWIVFSYVFSFYIDKFNDFSLMYGSLATIIILMLWLYFCMYIMFIGAEINVYFSAFVSLVLKKKKTD